MLLVVLLVVIAWAAGHRLSAWPTNWRRPSERALTASPASWAAPRPVREKDEGVAPTRVEWAQAALAGTASWLSDCSCLAAAFLAVGAPVPWSGLLLAYCGGQLAVNLPITPGGLGVVEGSLTLALLFFGGGKAPTVAAVLLYRLFSFWLPLPVGAGCWLGLAEMRRRERASRTVTAEPDEPGPDEPGPDEPGAEGQ